MGEDYGGVPEEICRVVKAVEAGLNTVERIASATGLRSERVEAVFGALLAQGVS